MSVNKKDAGSGKEIGKQSKPGQHKECSESKLSSKELLDAHLELMEIFWNNETMSEWLEGIAKLNKKFGLTINTHEIKMAFTSTAQRGKVYQYCKNMLNNQGCRVPEPETPENDKGYFSRFWGNEF